MKNQFDNQREQLFLELSEDSILCCSMTPALARVRRYRAMSSFPSLFYHLRLQLQKEAPQYCGVLWQLRPS